MGYADILTEENLCEWYERLSIRQIAKRVGCSQTTVSNYMDKHGIPKRSQSEGVSLAFADPTCKIHSEEYQRKRSEISRAMWADPTSIVNTEEYRRQRSESMKLAYADPELRRKVSERTKAMRADPASIFNTEEYRHRLSKSLKARWANEEYRESRCGEGASNWRGGLTERTCGICGCTFSVPPSRVRKGHGRFCSLRCFREWHVQNMRGAIHPSWRGGPLPYPPTFNAEFKQKIRERDGYTCAICRSHWEEGERAYPVHHINYVKNDTVPENCITLCHSCHGITGSNRAYWQRVLTDTVWATRAEQLSMDYPDYADPLTNQIPMVY